MSNNPNHCTDVRTFLSSEHHSVPGFLVFRRAPCQYLDM